MAGAMRLDLALLIGGANKSGILKAVYEAANPSCTQAEFYEVLGRFYPDDDGDLCERDDLEE